MAIEIERKFLVKGPFTGLAKRCAEVVQVYLSADPDRVIRIRKIDKRAFLTIKSGAGELPMARKEWEFEIPLKEAEEIIKISLPGRIEKTRYYIPYKRHTWEVDLFHGRNEGLVIAEIELSSFDEKFEIPDWIGEEVTGDPAYYNVNLLK